MKKEPLEEEKVKTNMKEGNLFSLAPLKLSSRISLLSRIITEVRFLLIVHMKIYTFFISMILLVQCQSIIKNKK